MNLMHFSFTPLALSDLVLRRQSHQERADKPQGLWVSDEHANNSWSWAAHEMGWTHRLKVAHQVTLTDDARILRLESCEELLEFTETYRLDTDHDFALRIMRSYYIDWERLAKEYQGILITPYIWACRNDPNTFWYYTWDCASGCIWDPAAIATLEVIPWLGKATAA